MKRLKKKLINVSYGIASSYDSIIELNTKLKKYPKLRKKILEHELRHKKGKYSRIDFDNDFNSKDSHFFEVFKYSLYNLEMLIGYMPIMYSYFFRKWTFNYTSIFPFFYYGLIFILFFLIFRVNPLFSFMAYFYLVVIINIILLIYTHYYVKVKKKVEF